MKYAPQSQNREWVQPTHAPTLKGWASPERREVPELNATLPVMQILTVQVGRTPCSHHKNLANPDADPGFLILVLSI